jgi:hypothetical protein
MNMMEMEIDYAKAWLGTRLDWSSDDGLTTLETVVMTGIACLGAAAIGAILWGKFKAGANNVTVPAPVAP